MIQQRSVIIAPHLLLPPFQCSAHLCFSQKYLCVQRRSCSGENMDNFWLLKSSKGQIHSALTVSMSVHHLCGGRLLIYGNSLTRAMRQGWVCPISIITILIIIIIIISDGPSKCNQCY